MVDKQGVIFAVITKEEGILVWFLPSFSSIVTVAEHVASHWQEGSQGIDRGG